MIIYDYDCDCEILLFLGHFKPACIQYNYGVEVFTLLTYSILDELKC